MIPLDHGPWIVIACETILRLDSRWLLRFMRVTAKRCENFVSRFAATTTSLRCSGAVGWCVLGVCVCWVVKKSATETEQVWWSERRRTIISCSCNYCVGKKTRVSNSRNKKKASDWTSVVVPFCFNTTSLLKVVWFGEVWKSCQIFFLLI